MVAIRKVFINHSQGDRAEVVVTLCTHWVERFHLEGVRIIHLVDTCNRAACLLIDYFDGVITHWQALSTCQVDSRSAYCPHLGVAVVATDHKSERRTCDIGRRYVGCDGYFF